MGKMDDFEPLPVEDVPSGTPDDKPPITDRPARKPRTRLTKWLAKIAGVYDGDLTPKTEDEYYLNEIAENGGGLPKVTAEDAGKVLTVDSNGDPAWNTPSGGGGAFVVTITDGVINASYNDIIAAAATSPVFLLQSFSDESLISYLTRTVAFLEDPNDPQYMVEFISTIYNDMTSAFVNTYARFAANSPTTYMSTSV